jgi:hypothetical protein
LPSRRITETVPDLIEGAAGMLGIIRELFFIVVVIAAIIAVTWWSGPGDIHLATGKSCHEVMSQLEARKDQNLTPAERTDVADCSGP